MKRMLISTLQNEKWRVAIIKGQKLYNLDMETPGLENKKSNIYKGYISRVEPSLEAVFINYGFKKHGFLPIKKISKEYLSTNDIENKNLSIKNFLHKGTEMIVQIDKEERSGKGATLTTFITLVGSYVILLPNNPTVIGISRKIVGVFRSELKEILLSLNVPDNMGIIIRTASVGKSLKVLQNDLHHRLNSWKLITKISKKYVSPILLYKESNLIIRALRDYLDQDISEILIDNPKILKFIYQNINLLGRTEFLKKLKLYTGITPLFSYFKIESQINLVFQRKIKLFSGGEIVIDTTEALTAIDVNSSRSIKNIGIAETAFNTNLEAVDEIARQIRLRDVGGLIVVDFIDMNLLYHQKIIENNLRKETKQDRAKVKVGQISKFGLLEMSRQRLNLSLGELSGNHKICSRCNGTGIIKNDNYLLSLSILRLIKEKAIKKNTFSILVFLSLNISCYLLNKKYKIVTKIKKNKLHKKIIIIPRKNMIFSSYSITCIKKEEIFKKISVNVFKIIINYKKYLYTLKNLYQSKIKNYFFLNI